MTIEQKWDSSRLKDYLLFDYWSPYCAWCVLAGFDYYAELDIEGNIDDACALDRSTFYPFVGNKLKSNAKELDTHIRNMRREVKRLQEFWHNGGRNDEGNTPQFIIDWALSKQIRPAWLDWAIDQGLYTPKELRNTPAQTNNETKEKPLGTTERTTLLTIIAALCDYSAIKDQDRGAATQIAKMTQEIGVPVSDDAIRKVLEKIPNALQDRMK